MKKILIALLILIVPTIGFAQISCTNATFRTLTSYTNGAPNDSLFFICQGQTGTLVATPPSGTPNWNFTWQVFNAPGNTWNPLTIVNNQPTSTQTNLLPGGYRVTIQDSQGTIVGVYIAWICRVIGNPSVTIGNIPPGCSNVQLLAGVSNGNITPYYNPPAVGTDPGAALIIGPSTTITVCFSANHTFVSDLGFYLRGPASCGSPLIPLATNPGTNCNAGDNINNLCFSTTSSNNFNVCGATTPLTGTYGSYGAAVNPINWSALYGCDASSSGWAVQIFDCVGLDVGALTSASITFSGTSVGGNAVTYTYATPSGFSSTINDNSCNTNTASIFSVGAPAAVPINFTYGFQWTANPPFNIPNSTSSLSINLNPGPTVDTQFTLTITGTGPGAICGGNSTSTAFFDYIESNPPVISPVAQYYCRFDAPITLSANVSGGTWSGTGITSASQGIFNPTVAGPGTFTITYMLPGNCAGASTIQITVIDQEQITVSPAGPFCTDDESVQLTSNSTQQGTWSGQGITDPSNGIFDPAAAGPGSWQVTFAHGEQCISQGSTTIVVESSGSVNITPVLPTCAAGDPIDLEASSNQGLWSGSGITNAQQGIFDPSLAGLGVHTITFTPTSSCSEPNSIDIEVIDDLVIDLNPVGPLCTTGSAINLTANQPNGQWSGPGITNAATGVFNPSTAGAGLHTINYAIANACNFQGSMVIEVQSPPSIQLSAPPQLCINASPVNITANIPGGTWSGAGISQNGSFNPQQAGSGNAVVTYTYNNVCLVTATATIVVSPLPNVNAGNDVAICAGNSTNLNASGAASYQWSPATGLSSTSSAAPNASPAATTTYTVVGTSAAGCTASDQVVVTVNPNPVVSVNGPFTICEGDQIQLQASGLVNYVWSPANLVSNLNASNPFTSPLNDQVFTVSGVNNFNCPGTATISVDVIETSITVNPGSGLAPLEVLFTNASEGQQFVWNFGDGDTYNASNVQDWPTHTYTQGGDFTAYLAATLNGTTCLDSITVFVFLQSELIKVPNIVTADGKGKNEGFQIVSQNLKNLEILIFNRWGNEVGKITSPTGVWTPADNGAGTYYYVLKGEGFDGVKYDRQGHFTVITE